MTYADFLERKQILCALEGLTPREPNPILFPFQRDITAWALKRGRACIWADCGLGKTFCQVEWASQIPGKVLIVAPLAVSQQTILEAKKLGVDIHYCRHQEEVKERITVTNYQMLEHFDTEAFSGLVCDESGILKAFDGATRNLIIDKCKSVPYRLAATATPAPNDMMEIGNHAEFVGAMTRTEMLSMFFVHDGGETQKWRLKGHAQDDFWKWVASWAVMLRKPSDLGYDDSDFILPALSIHEQVVDHQVKGDYLFAMEARTLQERISARRESLNERVERVADLVKASSDPWVLWCNLNGEADLLEKRIPGAVQISGSDELETKIQKLTDFSEGRIKDLISKPSITGHGLNWQHCHNMAFVGLSDSWEQYYQAVRRCWRFGQKHPVAVHIITSSAEGAVVANIKRKELDADKMAKEMVKHMHSINEANLKGTVQTQNKYETAVEKSERWECRLGDCVDLVASMPDESVGYSIFSPPFESLYTYSASTRDMGNSKNSAEFFEHFKFLVKELFRVMQSGRDVSFHCMNLPTSKTRDGVIGIRDFRGDLIRLFQAEGFIYHSEACIWKDPVTAMQRTKALGLLWKQLKKDSTMSRQGIADYLVTVRKPGENKKPVAHTPGEFPVDQWQMWASPVWMDINPSDTLQYRSAREHNDERHIAPLQLEVIRRGIVLWSAPGDLVLDPFTGIGSTGWVALRNGRRFIGTELKRSYWIQSCANLKAAESEVTTDLFNRPSPDPEPAAQEET